MVGHPFGHGAAESSGAYAVLHSDHRHAFGCRFGQNAAVDRAGEVGSHLAKLLSHEGQDIVLADADAAKLDPLDANYNLLTVCGNPTSFATLREAHAGDCDLFVAVTPYETNNLTACSIAKSFGARAMFLLRRPWSPGRVRRACKAEPECPGSQTSRWVYAIPEDRPYRKPDQSARTRLKPWR